MTSRERVLNALNHIETDKVPLDLSGHRSSGIAAIAYAKLRDHLGLEKRPIRVYDMVQQLAIVDEDVLDLFEIDTIEMGRGFLKDDKDWKSWVLPDGTPCEIPYYMNVEKKGDDWVLMDDDGLGLGIMKPGCLYFEQIHFPLAERNIAEDDFSDLADIIGDTMWTGIAHPGAHLDLDDEQERNEMVAGAKALRESTDRAIVGLFGGNLFEIPQMLFRMDNYLLDIAMHPDKVLAFSELLCDYHMKNLEKWLGTVGPYIDIILFGDDLGGQWGPLIGPDTYKELYKPYHKKMWNRAKEIADVKVMLHCCGGVNELLDDLIDAGLDTINPVQISCAGMEPAVLKEKFGDRITFWGGGCDTQHVLSESTPAEVEKHVKEEAGIMKKGGGFIFQQVHNILANVPPENILSMFKAVNN